VQVVDPKEISHDLGDVTGGGGSGGNGGGGAHVFQFQTHISRPSSPNVPPLTLSTLHSQLVAWLPELPIARDGDAAVVVRTLRLTMSDATLDAAWEWTDESLAMYVLCVVRRILLDYLNNNKLSSLEPGGEPQLMCYE
jgi:hypothetical protein